jgi:hypothetical protein
MKLRLAAWVLVAACVHASPAAAQVDDSTRTAARALGTAGVDAYQAGDYPTASDKLEKAYGLLKVPTLGLWSGRALVKLGKWVEASERFLETTSLQVPAGDYAVQKPAQADAAEELKALLPKVPVVTVKVEGAALADCSIDVDGHPVATSLLAAGRMLNPGAHVLEARRGNDRAQTEVTATEGMRTTAVLKFTAAPPVAAAEVPVLPPPAPPVKDGASGSTQRTLGWVALGTGGAGIVLGAITGSIALGKKSDIESNAKCLDYRCAPSESDLVNSYNTMNTLASVGFIAGGVLAATGVVLLVTAPSGSASTGLAAQAFVGPGSLGMRGRF